MSHDGGEGCKLTKYDGAAATPNDDDDMSAPHPPPHPPPAHMFPNPSASSCSRGTPTPPPPAGGPRRKAPASSSGVGSQSAVQPTSSGCKGEGKYSSLGRPLPVPEVVDLEESACPPPLAAYSPEEVDGCFGSAPASYYRIPPEGFWDGSDLWSVVKGSRVLWKSGARRGRSTKVELFSGMVQDCRKGRRVPKCVLIIS